MEIPENSELLELMEEAAAFHFSGLYADSNDRVEKAYALSEKLYTPSVSKNLFSLFTDDRALDFQGEDFERVALHDLAMINYIVLRRPDDAVVEARRLDELFNTLKQKRSEEELSHLGGFSRYLSALAYEEAGLWNDALIDYEHAAKAYHVYARDFNVPFPNTLIADLNRLRAKMAGTPAPPRFPAKNYGELIVLLYENQLPSKRVFLLELKKGHPVPRPHLRIAEASLDIARKRGALPLELMENVVEKTRFYIERRMGEMKLRNVTRGALKGSVNLLLAYFTGGNLFLPKAQADTRLWNALPAGVRLAKIPLPAGNHAITLNYLTIYGKSQSVQGSVVIRPGKATLSVFRATEIRP